MTTLAELENRIYDHSLKLYLPLSYMDGLTGVASICSKDAYGTPFTPTGAYWTPLGWFFDGSDDELLATAANTTHLNFVAGDFSVIVRVKHNDSSAINTLLGRYEDTATGWSFWVNTSEAVIVKTHQAAASQLSKTANAAVVDGEIYTIGFSRTGAAVKIYVNGIDKTGTAGTHINPGTSARILGIGSNGYGGQELKGTIKCTAVWSRWLAPTEHLDLHQMMKEVFP